MSGWHRRQVVFSGVIVRRVTLVSFIGCVLAGCGSEPPPVNLRQPETIAVEGSYVHPVSGMTFPVAVGEFRRVNLIRYDAAGADVSVGYNLGGPTGGVVATVYVYPASSLGAIDAKQDAAPARVALCGNEFQGRKAEIFRYHRGVRVVDEKDVPITFAGTSMTGRMAAFAYDDVFGGRLQPLQSELYIFCYVGDAWTIAYRFTAPREFDATRAIAAFMLNLSWTISSSAR